MWQDVCGVRLCDAVELERVGAVVWEILPTIEGSAIEARSKDLKDPTPINRAPNSPTPGRTGGGGASRPPKNTIPGGLVCTSMR